MISAWTGLVAGSIHVVSGPDHIAALAPITVHNPRRAARLGSLWGLGHGTGVLVLGALGIWARPWIELEVVSAWSEFLVGGLLIGMGIWSLRIAHRIQIHSHGHQHDQSGEHAHLHVHLDEPAHGQDAHLGHGHAAFGVGMLHGAAGAGHIFGVLPSLALPTDEAAVYLVSYFVAAVASMSAVGLGLGRITRGRTNHFMRQVMVAVGLVALFVGALWLSHGTPLA